MRRLALVGTIAAVAGCSQILGLDKFHLADGGGAGSSDATPLDGSPLDAMPGADAPPDTSSIVVDAGKLCLGTLAQVCFDTAPLVAVTLPAGTLDTDSSALCASVTPAGGSDVCVIAGSTVTLPAADTLIVTGSHPLVLFASDMVEIEGTLDASSTPSAVGAGGNATACGSAAGKSGDGGGGGGPGGSFGSVGGTGADGFGADQTQALAAQTVTFVRGGCAGGSGGIDPDAMPGQNKSAVAGNGGGAIDLLAGTEIVVSGGVFASGGGGNPNAGPNGGGGGGGTGGLIALEAPTISATGTIAANGGGGGGGGTSGQGKVGNNGGTTQYNMPAAGGQGDQGNGNNRGGPGGAGAATAIAAQSGMTPQEFGGGGGGGGGVGIVWVHGTLTGGVKVSPAPQVH